MNSTLGKPLHNLRIRLTLICVLITGILLCASAVLLLWTAENQMQQQRSAMIQSSTDSIVFRIQNSRVIDDAWLSQLETGGKLIVHIEDNRRPILFRGSWTPLSPRTELITSAHQKAISEYGFDVKAKPKSVIQTESIVFEMSGIQGERYDVSIVSIPSTDGWQSLTLLKDLNKDTQSLSLLRTCFFAVIFAALLLLLLFSLWFSKKALLPVAENHQKHVDFIASASHELRAPLSLIKASLSAQRDAYNPELSRHYGDISIRECSRLTRLVDDLLLLASADASRWALKTEPVDVDTLLTELYESFEPVAAAKNQDLSLHLPDQSLPIISGDRQRLSQAVTAILDNAFCYTPENGHIQILGNIQGHYVTISISDDGLGIKPHEKNRVFDRFYRSETSHSDQSHYGLGLSIVQEIIRLHRGNVSIHDSDEGGTCFIIKLPIS